MQGKHFNGLLVPLLLYTLEKIVVFLTFYSIFGDLFIYKITTNWDALDYLWVAEYGYVEEFLYAFSPVYPALIKGLTFLTGLYPLSSLIITNVFGYIFVILSFKFYGFKASTILSTFPVFVIYSTIPYSEPIALTFLILSLNLGGWLSSLALGGAIATFYNLAYTLPSFILKYKRKIWYFLPPLAVGGAIIVAFWVFTGSPFTFFDVERKYWDAYFANPICQAKWVLNHDFSLHIFPWFQLSPPVYLVRNYLFVTFYILGAILLYKRTRNFFLTAYSLSVIIPLLFLNGWPSFSLPRLLLPAFPSLLGYADLVFKRKVFFLLYFSISLFLTFFFTRWQALGFFA